MRLTSFGTFLVVVLLCAHSARAQHVAATAGTTAVYAQPIGFWLMPRDRSGRLYGPTAPSANWAIAQWGSPKDLPAFNSDKVTENEMQRVKMHADGSYSLSQNTRSQPCTWKYSTGKNLVKETDLFASPNNRRIAPDFPQATVNDGARLSAISHIFHELQLRPTNYRSESSECQTSQAAFITAVVLSNPTSKQTLFYQLRLAAFRSFDSKHAEFPAAWFFTGKNMQNGLSGQYGFGDNVTTYGQPFAEMGKWTTYRLDVSQRIKSLIALGALHGMDQDLSHWVLSGTYHGLSAIGHVSIAGEWRDFALAFK